MFAELVKLNIDIERGATVLVDSVIKKLHTQKTSV